MAKNNLYPKIGESDGEEIGMMSAEYVEFYRTVFNKYDTDHDGKIPLKEFKNKLSETNIRHELKPEVLERIILRADHDRNGYLEFPEFLNLVNTPEIRPRAHQYFGRYVTYATKLVVPRRKRTQDIVDGTYIDEYNCWPPPITIIAVSLIEVAIFAYYAVTLGGVSFVGPVPFDSPLIYNPKKRQQAWRFFTYMFIHAGFTHIFFNIFIQLLLGIPLELVHKYWRVWIVYMAGVVAGSLATSITDPNVFLAGASGGVYAILFAHLATIIMNYEEMDFRIPQLIGFTVLIGLDVGVAIYSRYFSEEKSQTGYVAHLAGAIAGLLVGIVALRNLDVKPWERIVWLISLIAFSIFIIAMIVWNIAFPSYFPPLQYN